MKFLPRTLALAASLLTTTWFLSATTSLAAVGVRNRPPNLLTNSNFEKGMDGWSFHCHRKKGAVTPDASVQHDGNPSIRVDNAAADDSQISQKVAVKPFTRYLLSGWVKTKDVVPETPKSTAGASVAVTNAFLKSTAVNKTQDWKRVTVEIVTKQESELAVGPRLGSFGGTVSGTAWFADLSLRELGPAKKQ